MRLNIIPMIISRKRACTHDELLMGEYKTDINTHEGREDRLGGNKKDINVSSRCVSCYGSLTPAGRVKSLSD